MSSRERKRESGAFRKSSSRASDLRRWFGGVAGLGLVLWVGLAVLGFAVAPAPPDPPVAARQEVEVQQRLAEWVVRDARRWQAEKGDLNIPWEQAEGHLAIVIDDVGRELRYHEKLQALRFPLTFSILPNSVYVTGAQARLSADRRRPREILLHLPMEPIDGDRMKRGPEARENFLLLEDSASQLQTKTRAALEAVPLAVGVNNHMGSRLTADRAAMSAIMPVLRERGMFFLDSRTSAETVAYTVARSAGVPALSRQVFLDHDSEFEAISISLQNAAEWAREAPVVAIGHPSAAVVQALEEQLPILHQAGIGVYPLSELLRHSAVSASVHHGEGAN